MEIIKQGTKNLAECLDCGTVMKYKPRDVRRTDSGYDHDEMEKMHSYYLNCSCGNQVYLNINISRGMRGRVDKIQDERKRYEYDL